MMSPGVPFLIRFFATSTLEGAADPLTLLRYACRYAKRTMPAMTAAPTPTRIEPRRVEKRFCAMSTTDVSSLLRHHDDARIDYVRIARVVVRPVVVAKGAESRRILARVVRRLVG